MKAIRVSEFGPPEVLKVEEVPDPKPADGQVLIRVKAVGVNPYETYIRSGTYAMKPPLPYTPGADAAGVVAAVGAGVKKFKAGDRVYTLGTFTGAYAEMMLCDPQHVRFLPDRVTFQQGAAMNVPYGTAYRGLVCRAKAKPGDHVLVHGATGGVGLAAVQIAVAMGMTVFGTGGTKEGRSVVMQQGAAEVFDHHSEGYLDLIKAATGGVGPDVILEMLANVNLQKDIDLIAKYGRIVVIGNRGKIEIDPRGTFAKESAILGMTYWGGGEAEVREAHDWLGAGLANGAINPVIAKEFALADAWASHEAIAKQGAMGKIVLIPRTTL